MVKIKKFFILIIFSLLFLYGCGIRNNPITIAIMTKLEAGSIVGSSEINAIKLFLEEHPIHQIEIYPVDDGWNPEKAKLAFEEIRGKNISFLITSHISTCAIAIMDSINQQKVFTFVTGAATPRLSSLDDYIFRNIIDSRKEQKFIAEYMNNDHYNNLLIIRDTDNDAYTEPALQYFKEHFKQNISMEIPVSIDNLNIEDLNQKLKGVQFNAVYLLIGGYKSEAGTIAQLTRKISPEAPIMFTPWIKTPALLETAGEAIKNSVIPSHYPPRGGNPKVDSYIDRYKIKYGSAPTFISLNVYTAIGIFCDAIQAGCRTPDEVKQYVVNKQTFITEFGNIRFDKNGDMDAPLYFTTNVAQEF